VRFLTILVALACILSGAVVPGEPAFAAGTATISGRVFSAPSTPLEGAGVSAFNGAGAQAGVNDGSLSGGYFFINGLAAGSYRLQFDSWNLGINTLTPYWGGASSLASAPVLTVTEGQTLDIGDIVIPPGATISGRLSPPGAPGIDHLISPKVVVYSAAGNALRETEPDYLGDYVVSGLHPGAYRLQFYDQSQLLLVAEFWNGKSTLASADPIVVGSQEARSGIDVTLQMSPSISGTVTGLGSENVFRGIAGVGVQVMDANGNYVGLGTTDSSGQYRISGLSPGSYRVQFVYYNPNSDDHWAPQWLGNVAFPADSSPVVVASGQQVTGIDAVLVAGGSIDGIVTFADDHPAATNVSVWAYLENATTGNHEAAQIATTNGSGAYSVKGLRAGRYVLRFVDNTPSSPYAEEYWNNSLEGSSAAPIELTAAEAVVGFDATLDRGVGTLLPGTLVKATSSPMVYLVDGNARLVPVASFSTVTDIGIGASVASVPQNRLDPYSIAGNPLTNLVVCGGQKFLGAQGRIAPIASSLVAGLASTSLQPSTCAQLPHSASTLSGVVFVKSSASPVIYLLENGRKRPILTWATLSRLAGADPLVILTANAPFVGSIPTGPDVLDAGMLVRSSSSPAIYLVDGAGGLIPISTFQSVSEMGLSTAFVVVSPATVAALTVAGSALSNIVSCGGETWIAANGKLWRTSSAVVGSLPVSSLPTALCAVIPKSGTTLSGVVFVKSSASPVIYLLENGRKRPILTWATLSRLAGADPLVILTANAPFVGSIPTGPDVLDAGMLVRSSSSPAIYLVDGAGGLIPISTFQSVSEMGLSTAFVVVSPATVAALTVAGSALSNIVSCGGETWIAANGKLWRTSSAVVGSLPVSSLPTALCAVIPKSGTTLSGVVFVKSSASPVIYLLENGRKRPILTWATLVALAGTDPLVIYTLNSAFVASIPAGAALPSS
jgi:hypothetical protein